MRNCGDKETVAMGICFLLMILFLYPMCLARIFLFLLFSDMPLLKLFIKMNILIKILGAYLKIKVLFS